MSTLFSPLTLRSCMVPNRIAMPPMASETGTESGTVTDATIDYYVARARAGVGLVIAEHTYVTCRGRRSRNQLAIYSDNHVPGLTKLADAVKREGSIVGIQITHAGASARGELIGCTPEAPSNVAIPGQSVVPEAISIEAIPDLQKAFVEAAVRARNAGFQMVELHGAHGYLLNEFLSPLTNTRSDGYGGSRDGRLRFALELTEQVREAIGPDTILAYRLGADDGMPGGLTLHDTCWAAPKLVEAGVDFLDISGGLSGSGRGLEAAEGYFTHLSDAIRRVVKVPVMVTGGIVNPSTANAIIESGKADVVGIGRAMLSDAGWAYKAKLELCTDNVN